jgi:hypothetical protein
LEPGILDKRVHGAGYLLATNRQKQQATNLWALRPSRCLLVGPKN